MSNCYKTADKIFLSWTVSVSLSGPLCKSKNKQFAMVPFEGSSIKVYNFENLLYTFNCDF